MYGTTHITTLIDLGTTTIAMKPVDNTDETTDHGDDVVLFSNPQSKYGLDVISRMESAVNGKQDELRDILLDELSNHIPKKTSRIIIGGNTAMIHILMGYDCTPLMKSPFEAKEKCPRETELFGIPANIIPWASAFIGGDIVSGLHSLEKHTGNSLFIDLGTNGEMVILRSDGEMFATATAAGPAFEGGNLSCGCAGIPGAISAVSLHPLQSKLTTIGNAIPVGLCGSGAISLVAELIRKGYILEDGTLSAKFPADGIHLSKRHFDGREIIFTADDLHEVTLAKAAIAAGIETLLKAAQITADDIDTLFLGGGFGYFVDPADCETVKIFASIPKEKTKPLGNTCLKGLESYALSSPRNIPVPDMHVINLGISDYFKERFVVNSSLV